MNHNLWYNGIELVPVRRPRADWAAWKTVLCGLCRAADCFLVFSRIKPETETFVTCQSELVTRAERGRRIT